MFTLTLLLSLSTVTMSRRSRRSTNRYQDLDVFDEYYEGVNNLNNYYRFGARDVANLRDFYDAFEESGTLSAYKSLPAEIKFKINHCVGRKMSEKYKKEIDSKVLDITKHSGFLPKNVAVSTAMKEIFNKQPKDLIKFVAECRAQL